ncbi:energy transducer TonB [Sphingomonas sp. ID0503]|uniref:energy transducer TonB n=1 Tax=Sphingomonas sp. ID0503 TaxID=3399691 RepID=UPI003AFAFFF2
MIGALAVQALIALALLLELGIPSVPVAPAPALKLFQLQTDLPPPPPLPEPRKDPAPRAAAAPIERIVPVVALPSPTVVHTVPIAADGSALSGAGSGTGSGGAGSGGGGGIAEPARQIAGDFRNGDFPRSARDLGDVSLDVAFLVGADGDVSDCTVTRSSGHSNIDTMTCRVITKRFRFAPARSASGEPVSQLIRETEEWSLVK